MDFMDTKQDIKKRTSFGDTPLFGAIDLGTNTCRLLIARCTQTPKGIQLSHVDSLSRVIRFGEQLEQTKKLSSHAMERAVMALDECQKRLHFHDVHTFRCVATAACRYATNTDELIQKTLSKTGIKIEVINPEEESELAVSGCAELFDPSIPYAIVFDIGGGSTELVLVDITGPGTFSIAASISFPYGFATLKDELKDEDTRRTIMQHVSSHMNEFAVQNDIYAKMRDNQIQMIGASGTITTLAAISMDLKAYDKSLVHEARLSKLEIQKTMETIPKMSYNARVNHACIGPQRADSITGGLALFEAIYDILSIEPVIAADRGVREGILYKLAQQQHQKT